MTASSTEILPMYPGYALGGIIQKDTVLLNRYNRTVLELKERIVDLTFQKQKLKAAASASQTPVVSPALGTRSRTSSSSGSGITDSHSTAAKAVTGAADSPSTQTKTVSVVDEQMAVLNFRLSRVEADLQKIEADRNALLGKGIATSTFSAEEMLPVDWAKTLMKVSYRSFYSERTSHLLFEAKGSLDSRETIFSSSECTYRRVPTRKGNASGLHALLGKPIAGEIKYKTDQFNPDRAVRAAFQEKLSKKVREKESEKFKNEDIRKQLSDTLKNIFKNQVYKNNKELIFNSLSLGEKEPSDYLSSDILISYFQCIINPDYIFTPLELHLVALLYHQKLCIFTFSPEGFQPDALEGSSDRFIVYRDGEYQRIEKIESPSLMTSGQSSGEQTSVTERVRSFISQLFLNESPSSYLPVGTIDNIIRIVRDMRMTGMKVSLLGAVITLPRVKTMDPIYVRKDAVPEPLKNECHNLYVLTEAVLGAALFGIVQHTSSQVDPGTSAESAMQSLRASLGSISFISQGAIPKIGTSLDKIDFWSVYNNWKEMLVGDEHAGYPIGFKYRKLAEVLAENGMKISAPSPVVVQPSQPPALSNPISKPTQ